jgi:RNA polymerase sigma factor (TIGR02999 family)
MIGCQVLSETVPQLVEKLRGGDQSALNELTPALYRELHRIASRRLSGERQNHTLQATALVHEAYLKLFEGVERRFADKAHFLAIASRVMRQVLVDYARGRATQKRSAGDQTTWTANLETPDGKGLELIELIRLNDAIDDLATENASLARVIEMRYFGGLTAEETAEALTISVHVVRHDLRFAQAWLKRRLQ